MKRIKFLSGMLAMALVFGMAGCDDVLGEFQKGLKEAETPAYSIVLDGVDGEAYVFETVDTKLALLVVNSGDEATGALTAELTGDSEAFTLSKTKLPSIKAGKSGTLVIAPVAGLAAGTYEAAVVLSGEAGIAATLDVSFTVGEAEATEEVSATEGTEYAKEPEEAKTYTVYFVVRGSGLEPESQTVAEGDKVKRPAVDPTREGYVFNGWYTYFKEWDMTAPRSSSIRYDFDSPVFSELAIITGWTDVTTGLSDRGLVDENLSYGITLIGQDGLPLRAHTFFGTDQYLNVVIRNTSALIETGYLTATLSGANPDAFLLDGYGSIPLIPSVGWSSSQSFLVYPVQGLKAGTYTATVTVSGVKVLPQSFDVSYTVLPGGAKIDYYTVTFDLNYDGATTASAQTIAPYGKATAPAIPTRTGYTLAGWYKDAALTTRWNFNTDTVTDHITLYAKWVTVTVGE